MSTPIATTKNCATKQKFPATQACLQLRMRKAANLKVCGACLSQTRAVSEGPLWDPRMVQGMAGSGRLDEIAWNPYAFSLESISKQMPSDLHTCPLRFLLDIIQVNYDPLIP